MKNLILIFALLMGVSANAQPKIVKKYNLKLVPMEAQLPSGTKMPKLYTGKWGALMITSKGKYFGYVIDSLTGDTTKYAEKRPSGRNAMRIPENGPSTEPDAIDPPQDLLDKEPQRQPEMQRMNVILPKKRHATFYILPYYDVQVMGSTQAVVDWMVSTHLVHNLIMKEGGMDIDLDIAGIHVFPDTKNWLDSILFDPRYPGSTKSSTIIRWAIEKMPTPGTCTGTYTTAPLGLGGLGYRNPSLQRYGSSYFVNGNRYKPSTLYPYEFTNYCGPHEDITGHNGGSYHAFNCIDKTDPLGKTWKVDSSFNEGSCNTILTSNPNGYIMSYQHLRQSTGGGIKPRWHPLEKANIWNNLALSSAISGQYLGAPALKVDSLVNRDDRFTLRITTPANINGTNWELRENGRVIQSGTMTQAALNIQAPLARPNGQYRYVAFIWNSQQRHHSDSFVVTVNRPTVALPPCQFDSICTNGQWVYTAKNQPCTGTKPPRSCALPPPIQDGVIGPVMHYTQNGTSFFRFNIPTTGDWRYEVAYCRYDGTMNPPDSVTPAAACGIRNALNFSRPTAAQLSAGQINLLAITQPNITGKWYRVRVRYRNGATGAILVKQSAWFWW